MTKAGTRSRWRTPPLGSTSVTGGFWARRQAVNRQVSIPAGFRQLEASGSFNNIRLAAGDGEGEFRTTGADTFVYKWLEAIAYDSAGGDFYSAENSLRAFASGDVLGGDVRAIAIDPADPRARLRLAVLCLRLDERAEAGDLVDAAAGLAPRHPDDAALLRQLQQLLTGS